MDDAPPPFLFDERILTRATAVIVLVYLATHLLARRGASAATRTLGLLLAAAAVNIGAAGLRSCAWGGGLTEGFLLTVNLSVLAVVLCQILFAYRFHVDDRPRERRVATGVCAAAIVTAAAQQVALAVLQQPAYNGRARSNWAYVLDPWAARHLQSWGSRYMFWLLVLGYGWALVVMVRKCVRLEREAGVGALRAVRAPSTAAGRGARDFSLLIAGVFVIPFTGRFAAEWVQTGLQLVLSCTTVWVYVSRSDEPTRLRFKLVALPLAVVLGLQAVLFTRIVEDAAAADTAAVRDEVRRVRARIDAAMPDADSPLPRLTADDVAADVRFVVAHPVADGAYATDHTPLFLRPGTDGARLDAADRREAAWRLDLVTANAGDDADPQAVHRLREAQRAWLAKSPDHRWAQTDDRVWYGAVLAPADRFMASTWTAGGRIFAVGWSELERRRAVHERAFPLLLALLATALVLVLALPVVFGVSVLVPMRDLLAGVRRVEGGDLTTSVAVRSNDELGILARAFDRMVASVRDAQERLERINAAAFRFVPRAFLSRIGRESILDVRLGDQRLRTMTVLFLDVRGFTSLAESMTPDATFAFVNDLLRRLGPAIRRHGGFIDKYLGDAVMALFDGTADDAVAAAVEVRTALAELNAERAARGAVAVRVGIGLHTGELMLGIIGESERVDGTVIADAVNIASRLEGLTKRYGSVVLVSAAVRDALRDPDRFGLRFVERVQVKGRSDPLDVHEVFEGDPPDVAAGKRASREALEAGVRAMIAARFADAEAHFAEALRVFPDDPVARLHVARARELAALGAPEGWDGAHRMDTK